MTDDAIIADFHRQLSLDPAAFRAQAASEFDQLRAGGFDDVVLFGAGALGRQVATVLAQDGLTPRAFIDSNEDLLGSELNGVPVMSARAAAQRFANHALFVTTSWRFPASETFAQRRQYLLDLGCKRVCSVFPVFWKYSEAFLPFNCADEPHKVVIARDAVLRAFALWHDEASRREFAKQVLWRIDPEHNDLDVVAEGTQYFPEDLFRLHMQEIFVDVGGYNGDTTDTFLGLTQNRLHGAHIIKADPGNFVRLQEWQHRLAKPVHERIVLHHLAASSERGTLSFVADSAKRSRVAASGTTSVACDRLDAVLAGVAPSIVKMDIEGAEDDALRGMQELIGRHQPILAICLYHRQADLWTIPNLIHSYYDRYRFFLKAHALDGWELVLYAVPYTRSLQ